MTNVIPFPPMRYQAVTHIDLASYIDQINVLTNDMHRYAEFIKKEADKFCAEVRHNAALASTRAETLIGYMHEMNKKSALIEQISKTMCSVHRYNESTTKLPRSM
jgi:hypothetical protein